MIENQKYIDLAKKLNALSKGGVGGEAFNAKSALDSLMKKYNISEDDIDEETQYFVRFFAPQKYLYLFAQIASTVVGRKREMGIGRYDKRYFHVKVTKIEELELRAKWEK